MDWTTAIFLGLAALQDPFAHIPRDDVRVGLMTVTESSTRTHAYPEILYVSAGAIEWGEEAAREGTVVFIPAGTSHTLSSVSAKPATLVFLRWAPDGDRDTLHSPSTMTEQVDIPPEARSRPAGVRRYLSGPAPSARLRTHIDDVEWTTNFTYSEDLWKVYRYKPLVRDALVDWPGIARDDVRMGLQQLDPGASYPTHHHPSPEIYVVVSGQAQWTVGKRSFAAEPGTAVYTPPDTTHRIENTGTTPLSWLYFWWAPGGDVSVFAEP